MHNCRFDESCTELEVIKGNPLLHLQAFLSDTNKRIKKDQTKEHKHLTGIKIQWWQTNLFEVFTRARERLVILVLLQSHLAVLISGKIKTFPKYSLYIFSISSFQSWSIGLWLALPNKKTPSTLDFTLLLYKFFFGKRKWISIMKWIKSYAPKWFGPNFI